MKTKIITILMCVFTLVLSQFACAQGRGLDRGAANSWLGLLRMPNVQTEIELVDDQKQQIEDLQTDMYKEMREQMSEMRSQDLEPSERRERYAELREKMEERQDEYRQKIEDILLPMQVKRLKELYVQSRARRNGEGALAVLKNSEILEDLGIDEETRKKLEEKAEEVQAELAKKIKKLKAEAEKEILSVLSSEQRKKLRELMGDTFDFGDRNRAISRAGAMDRNRNRGRGSNEPQERSIKDK